MKWILLRCISAVVLSTVVTPSFSDPSARIIFGLTNAQHFQSKHKGDFYIQMGSFSSRFNASTFQKTLGIKTKFPIVILQKSGSYKVAIGPIHSASGVRSVGQSLRVNPTVTAKIIRPEKVGRSFVKEVSHPKPALIRYRAPSSKISSKPAKSPSPSLKGNWFIAAGAGGQFPLSQPSMTVDNGAGFPEPYSQDIYSTRNSNQVILGAALGRRWYRDKSWFPTFSLGGSYQHFFTQNVGGTVMQNSLPEFVNYNYRWNLESDVVLAIAKLNLLQYQRVSPFINGGVGAAFNHASGYSETALSGITPRISPSFENKSKGHFSYNLGAGLDFQVIPQMFLSLGYLYQDFGDVTSGIGTQTWSSQSLSLGSYRSNNVFFSVNYLFK